MELLHWYNLAFLAPLGLAGLYLIVGAWRVGVRADRSTHLPAGVPPEGAAEPPEAGPEVQTTGGGEAGAALSAIPVPILLVSLLVIFGAGGLACNYVFAEALPLGWGPAVYFWRSLVIALVVACSLTGLVARGLWRVMREERN